MSIPKRIHYCYLSDEPVPGSMRRCVESWRRMLPGYEFVKWDRERIKNISSVWVSEALAQKKYAFASDFIRIYAVYRYGGIYLDMDVEVRKPFDGLLEQPYMFAYESTDRKRIEAGCFGAERHDPFLKACLAYYRDRHFVNHDGRMDMLPLSKVMGNILRKRDTGLTIYSREYFTAKDFMTGNEITGRNTYAIHHFAGSWKDAEERRIIQNARRIRNHHPLVGKYAAFVYEKTWKAVSIIKNGGGKELCHRIRQYLKG